MAVPAEGGIDGIELRTRRRVGASVASQDVASRVGKALVDRHVGFKSHAAEVMQLAVVIVSIIRVLVGLVEPETGEANGARVEQSIGGSRARPRPFELVGGGIEIEITADTSADRL